jgi:hypothetical protein
VERCLALLQQRGGRRRVYRLDWVPLTNQGGGDPDRTRFLFPSKWIARVGEADLAIWAEARHISQTNVSPWAVYPLWATCFSAILDCSGALGHLFAYKQKNENVFFRQRREALLIRHNVYKDGW